MAAIDRGSAVMRALGDRNSAFYKNMVQLLRESEAAEKRARAKRPHVVVPFPLIEEDVVALENQFGVSLKIEGHAMRAQLSRRSAAVVHCIDASIAEHAMSSGRTAMLIDGDLMTAAAVGLEGRLIERSGCTPRVAAGYAMEDEAVRRFASVRNKQVNTSADVLVRELTEGGGEHYWPVVRADGPRVDSIGVNHFKTHAGPHQLAWLAHLRGATVFGALPFQLDMLTADKGRLAVFPGWFYVDRESDVITLVPDTDATMSISHPYSCLVDILRSNSVTVSGHEFLCEKYMSVRGVMWYTLKKVGCDFAMPEELRTCYYDSTKFAVTEIQFPKVKHSAEGVPIGWDRGLVRLPTSRYERVLQRVMVSRSQIVKPAEVFVALMDYNNLVVNTLDSAEISERISVEDEQELALAIALHVNFRRHQAKGTFNSLMSAMRVRHSCADASLLSLALMALTAWWSAPNVKSKGVVDDLPMTEVVDWCGNDFSVIVKDANPWVEVVQVVGEKKTVGGRFFPWFPRPFRTSDSDWFRNLKRRAVEAVGFGEGGKSKRLQISSAGIGLRSDVVEPVTSKVTLLDTFDEQERPQSSDLSSLKAALRDKFFREQGAFDEGLPPGARPVVQAIVNSKPDWAPVPDVEPVSAMRADLVEMTGGLPERDVVSTGYRMAEVDIVKNVDGCLSINDSKRLVPDARFVRKPRVDAGVEGKRVSSQAALLGAVFKRNIGIPNNRGAVDLDVLPDACVQRLIDVCFREGWESILQRHLETGLWEPNLADLDEFLHGIDERKARDMLDEFFIEGDVRLDRWLMMAKGKIKSSREPGAEHKVDHSQTILYLENKSTNAMYSSITKRVKVCLDEMLRPEVCLNAQQSDEQHEQWYNSLEAHRQSFPSTFSYAADIRCYDRSQEHPALKAELALYRRLGLTRARFEIWEQTHGTKKAVSMMYGVVFSMVLGGVSGLWKTLLRNGVIALTALVVSTNINRRDVVMIDIKGDDLDAEFARPVQVETSVERMSLTFNLSAKFFTNDVRYMCKQFRIKLNGRWYFVADPWAKAQTVCTPMWIGNHEDTLAERWVSLRADLRHYDNGILVERVAEACQQYYQLKHCPYGLACALSKLAEDRNAYFNFFLPAERVD